MSDHATRLIGSDFIVLRPTATLHSCANATPRQRGLLALAAWSLVCFGLAELTHGQGTLIEFIDGGESAAAEEFDGSSTEAQSPLAGDSALERPIAPEADLSTDGYEGVYDPPYGAGIEDQPDRMPGNMPVSWISGPYLRYGVDFVIGEGVLEGGQKLGWGINGGFRQAFAPGLAPGNMFFDLGGGYLSAVGNTHRLTPGLQTNEITNATSTVANAYSVNLTEVKRAGVNLALGWYWGDAVDCRADDPRLRFATRFGGRFGSVRGRFLERRVIEPVANSTMKSTYLNTDTFGGLFVGTEAILLKRTYSTCNVLWTADVEFANDWIEFGGFDSGSLGTASLMTGIMLSR